MVLLLAFPLTGTTETGITHTAPGVRKSVPVTAVRISVKLKLKLRDRRGFVAEPDGPGGGSQESRTHLRKFLLRTDLTGDLRENLLPMAG